MARKSLYAQRRKEGLCYHCGEPATVGRYCLDSWYANTAFNNLGSRKLAPLLKELWAKQKGYCYYTGTKLVPGDNASLCRLRPPSKGGGELRAGLSNLCWTTKTVARMKNDLTDRDFMKLCRTVVRRRSKS